MQNNSEIGIISQARMTSTRLPGKVLKNVAGKSLLEYHLNRLSWSELPVVVATTIGKTDDPIVQLCQHLNIPTFRGDENDVLSRYYLAAQKFQFKTIIRVTSDCPLIDGKMIRKGLDRYLLSSQNRPHYYLSNCLQRSYPRGLDFEIFSWTDLKEAYEKATLSSDREHVTPYLHQNRNQKMHLLSYENSQDESRYRLTVDEMDDFKLIESLIAHHSVDRMEFPELLTVLKKNPELALLNSHVEQKKI